jgi:aminoglycoside/choline kinase family phosphotransferase
MSRLPTSSAQITPEWLTEQLRSAGTIDASTSVSSVAGDAVGPGIGFMGEVGRVSVSYSGGTGPTSMICKIPTQDPNVRGLLAAARVFEREARFYADVAPALDVVPQAYAVAADYEHEDFVLVLQDLGHLRVGDQAAGVSEKDAHAALRAAARLHARYWQNAALDAIDWMPRADSEGMKIGREVYQASLPGFLQVFAHAVDPDMVPIMERFGDNVHQLLDRISAMPNTVAHFDYRLDNLFFDDDADRVWMIDFQTSSKGGGAYDVGYFMSQSVPVDVRRRCENDLLRTYHDELTSLGVKNYSFDQFFQDYRVGVLYGWIIPVYAVGTLDSSSERAMKLWTEVIVRAQAAMRDHSVADFMI